MAHLTLLQRQLLEKGIAEGKSNARIARELGVHRSTVGRELKRHADCRENYRAAQAHQTAKRIQRMAISFRNICAFGGIGYFTLLAPRQNPFTYPYFQWNKYFGGLSPDLIFRMHYEKQKEYEKNRFMINPYYGSFFKENDPGESLFFNSGSRPASLLKSNPGSAAAYEPVSSAFGNASVNILAGILSAWMYCWPSDDLLPPEILKSSGREKEISSTQLVFLLSLAVLNGRTMSETVDVQEQPANFSKLPAKFCPGITRPYFFALAEVR